MEVLDLCGKTISVGSYVIYNGTGTFGEVLDTRTDEEGTWAKILDTELWYNSEYLEVVEKPEKIEALKKAKKEDLREKIKKKEIGLEDVDMSGELCDGGG